MRCRIFQNVTENLWLRFKRSGKEFAIWVEMKHPLPIVEVFRGHCSPFLSSPVFGQERFCLTPSSDSASAILGNSALSDCKEDCEVRSLQRSPQIKREI
jgi:hypothetical protein